MSLERDRESTLYTYDPGAPVRTALPTNRPTARRPSAPPPYTGPRISDFPAVPPLPSHLSSRAGTPTPSRTLSRPEVPTRHLPSSQRPRTAGAQEQYSANVGHSEPPSRGAGTPTLRAPLSLATPLSSSLRTSQPLDIPPFQHRPAPPSAQITKSRSFFRPFTALKVSKATRNATPRIAKQGASRTTEEAKYEAALARLRTEEEEAATREREDELRFYTEAQAGARETVKSCIQTLLSRGHTSEETRLSVFSTCSQVCKKVGLDLSAVLQEPIIEGQTPIYWAILNRPVTSSDVDVKTSDALIIALLNVCGLLKETTIVSVRLACMLISNNALLQHLFWNFPGLSPLTTKDRMLLGATGGGDIVDVEEPQDGTGEFITFIQIRRFRMRMNVSMVVKVEFVTFERFWTATFSASTERTAGGSSENKRLFSLELANGSIPACVDAVLHILGHSYHDNTSDSNESIFSAPVSCDGRSLQPGPGNAIKVRLDDGPMGHHWVNDSQAFVDSDGTLHAQLNVKLTQPKPMPPAPPMSPDLSDAWSQVSSVVGGPSTSGSHSDTPRPTKGKKSKKVKDPNKPVYTSLRRGGR